MRRGLAEGVPLTLELDLDVERVRQLLPNSRVAELTQRYHLQYNAVSARYILRNENSGQQESLSTIDAAIEQLSEVRGLPVLDKALLAPDRRYEASVRAKIDYGTRAVQLAPADVLGQRVASRERLVHMDAAAVIRKYGATVLGSIGRGAVAGRAVSAGVGCAEFRQVRPLAAVDPADQHLRIAHAVRAAGRQALLTWCRDFRRHAPGSRLKGRTVAIFSALAVAPDPGGLLLLPAVHQSRHR